MTIPRRRCPRPVPHEPSHQRTWRSLWRRCSCGLPAPCVDRLVPAPPLPFPPKRAAPADHRSTPGDGTHPPMSASARIPAPRASPIRPAQPGYDDTARIPRISPSAYLEANRAASREASSAGPAAGWAASPSANTVEANRAASARRPAWPIAGRADTTSGRHRADPHRAGPHRAEPHQAGPHRAGPHRAGPHQAGPHTGSAACARDPAPPPGGTVGWAPTGSGDHRRPTGTALPHIPTGPSGFIRAGDSTGADAVTQARAPAWAVPTVLLSQVGRAGDLTPAQAYRASQGPWR